MSVTLAQCDVEKEAISTGCGNRLFFVISLEFFALRLKSYPYINIVCNIANTE